MPASSPTGLLSTFYNTLLRRNTSFLGMIFIGAFATQFMFETGANRVWDSINRGRQWKDIKQRYMEQGDE